ADEHRDRGSQGPAADGPRDESGGGGGAAVLPRRADAETAICRSQQSAGRAYLVAVTMCAAIGASRPFGPSNGRSASRTPWKTRSPLPASSSSTSTPIGVP